jgi:asparagine synthase (glutamine-hydrolysing)
MCGLVAVFSNDSINPNVIDGPLDCMFARGPDDCGIWSSDGVIFGHRRLAVIDLDKRATQPMSSFDDRYVIVFNGEIYNYEILKTQLLEKGFTFLTSSDTEVLLAMYQEYGQEMLSKLEGMFSFVIWDKFTRIGFAARDPYGIKPLYIGSFDNGFVFASQVKAVLATNLISKDIDFDAQQLFWMLGSVPEPYTWFRKIQSLGSGQCAHISSTMQLTIETWLDIGYYWRSSDEIIAFTSLDHIQDVVKRCLKESVNRHLVADVSVGLLLSGGIDSGALAGLVVDEIGADKVTGITISFDEFEGDITDEAPIAKEIAQYYGIKHLVRKVTKDEFLADLPAILRAMDQPSIDGVNTWYACKAASEVGFKVVLSGVGGDELFLGYESFQKLPFIVKCYQQLLKIPFGFKISKVVTSLLAKKTNNSRWIFAQDWLKTISGAWWLRRSFSSPLDLLILMRNLYPHTIYKKNFDPALQVHEMTGVLPSAPELALAQIESMCYLRNQLLRDADWASMSHSVELRTPLVDEKLLRSIAPLMPYLKYFPGKILLANAPNKPLPASISSRPKTGFGIPILEWLSEDRKTKFIVKQDRWSWARKVVRSYEASIAS